MVPLTLLISHMQHYFCKSFKPYLRWLLQPVKFINIWFFRQDQVKFLWTLLSNPRDGRYSSHQIVVNSSKTLFLKITKPSWYSSWLLCTSFKGDEFCIFRYNLLKLALLFVFSKNHLIYILECKLICNPQFSCP